MSRRGISDEIVDLVLRYGRKVHTRNVILYVVGRKEVRELRRKVSGIEQCNGVHVLLAPDTGNVITVYRNHDLQLR